MGNSDATTNLTTTNRPTNDRAAPLAALMTVYNHIYSSLVKMDSLGPNNQTGILAKCPVSQSYGSTIHERLQSEHDYTEVGQTSISQIKLSIRDAHSNLINLNGSSWSATIIFRILN